jgi:hypothetical protein
MSPDEAESCSSIDSDSASELPILVSGLQLDEKPPNHDNNDTSPAEDRPGAPSVGLTVYHQSTGTEVDQSDTQCDATFNKHEGKSSDERTTEEMSTVSETHRAAANKSEPSHDESEGSGDTCTLAPSDDSVPITEISLSTDQLTTSQSADVAIDISTCAREPENPQRADMCLSKSNEEARAADASDGSSGTHECGATTDADETPEPNPVNRNVRFSGVDIIKVFDNTEPPEELKSEARTTCATSDKVSIYRFEESQRKLIRKLLGVILLRVEVTPSGVGGVANFRIRGDSLWKNGFEALLEAEIRPNPGLSDFTPRATHFSIRPGAFPDGIVQAGDKIKEDGIVHSGRTMEDGRSLDSYIRGYLGALAFYVNKIRQSEGLRWDNTAYYHGDIRFE